MGTVAEVAVLHEDSREAHRAIDAALEELRRVERTMTRHRSDSEVGRANENALRKAVPVGAETATVLEEALRWAECSGGRFDPCLGRLTALWDVGFRSSPPDEADVGRLTGDDLFRFLEVERGYGSHTVRFHDPRIALDLGGIGKGYAVDRAVRALRELGIEHGLVNAGGDLYAMGRSEDGDAWRVGVQSPANPGRLLTTLDVSDIAIATSGDYMQYFDHDGRRYHHLVDPRTGAPRMNGLHGVTVSAADCMTADAAATTVFGAGRESGRRLLAESAPDARILVVA
jgi:thiamine biosynthesis lipoprotein